MTASTIPAPSPTKTAAKEDFRAHVSSGKVAFFETYGMDFVPGRREGPYLWDIDGKKRLFNLHCNGGVYNLGHRHPDIIRALTEALEEVDIGNSHLISKGRADLARRLSDCMPGDLTYTIFGASGGEAVDLAIKVARAFTHKETIISALGGYHGHTGLAMAAGDEKYRAPFGTHPPGFLQVPFGDLQALEKAMDGKTAAVILETVPATLGIAIPPPGYVQAVRALCTRRDVLLIMDEVQTGLGRTGKLWGFEHFDIVPDMVVLGKGLSGGIYPITATVIRQPLEAVFHADPFIHVSTFGGAEPGCRVALRMLDISADPDFLAHVRRMADRIKTAIDGLIKTHAPFLKGLRQLGLMMGLELADDMSGMIMSKAAFDHDLLMVYANNCRSVCQFLPPLIIKDADVDHMIRQLDAALGAAKAFRKELG